MQEPKEIGVCPHCHESVYDDSEWFEDEDGMMWHSDCYEAHRLDEVTDAYNKEGVKGLKKIEAADELDELIGLS